MAALTQQQETGRATGTDGGVFVSFEGGDGTGKSTQCSLLAEHLARNGLDPLVLHEPGGTRVGERIREVLLDNELSEMDPVAELLLYEAARAQLVAELIGPALEAGRVVICDRFADSTDVYQGVGRGLGTALTGQLNSIAVRGVEPQRTVLLCVDGGTARSRLKSRAQGGQLDRMEQAGSEFHRRVEQGFADIARAHAQRVRAVDASGTVDEVQGRVFEALADLFPGVPSPGSGGGA